MLGETNSNFSPSEYRTAMAKPMAKPLAKVSTKQKQDWSIGANKCVKKS